MFLSFSNDSDIAVTAAQPAYDPFSLRYRYYDPTIGQFTSFDAVMGNVRDPMHHHKYLYGGADPINNVDPSGKDWSLTSFMVTGGIIGGVVGLTAGATYGTYRSGSFFSWETAKWAVLGAVGGAALGALIGGSAYVLATGGVAGFTNVMRVGFREFITKFRETGSSALGIGNVTHNNTLFSAVIGFFFGVGVGFFDPEPDRAVDLWNAIDTATLATTTTFIKGVAAAGKGVYFPAFGEAKFLLNDIAGGGFIAVAFAAGFTAGYALGHEVRLLFKKREN